MRREKKGQIVRSQRGFPQLTQMRTLPPKSWSLSGKRGSNSRPPAWRAGVLPTELFPRETRASAFRSFRLHCCEPLSYGTLSLSRRADSNRRPLPYHGSVLPTELQRLVERETRLELATFCLASRLSTTDILPQGAQASSKSCKMATCFCSTPSFKDTSPIPTILGNRGWYCIGTNLLTHSRLSVL